MADSSGGLNICFLSREYPPETHVGGIGTYTYNMAGALSKLGHTVHVITSTAHQCQTCDDNGVLVHRIKTKRSRLKELEILAYSYAAERQISGIDCRFDIVQASEFASEGFWTSLKRKYPLVTRLATPYFLIERINGKVYRGPRPFFNWMEKRQTLASDGIFTSTHAIADIVTQEWGIDPDRVKIIPNSVDISRVIHLGNEAPLPSDLAGQKYILYFGRLEERKGVHILAGALDDVFSNIPDVKAVFAGADCAFRGGSMRQYISDAAREYSDRLLYFDNLSQAELFPIVSSAAVVVLPSLWEAFGFVCVEAMALGRPVIASSGSGFEEIIEDNVSGYLVEPGDSGLLARKVIESLKDDDSLKRISEGAGSRAKCFDVYSIAERLLDYYAQVIAQNTSGN